MADLLKGDVDIPGAGKFPKSAVVLGVGGVIALILWKKHQQSQAASTASTAAGTTPAATSDPYPPDGTVGDPSDPNSTDPSTGMTYGDEAIGYTAAGEGYGDLYGTGYGGEGDVSGYGTASDAYPWDGTYNNPSDPYSMDTSTGQTYGDEGSATSSNTGTGTGPPFSTNAQWSQYVLNYFTQQQFSDISGMTAAIGLYLAGSQVNTTQQGYINDAIAIAGTPPVSGPNNMPPSINLSGSTSTTGSVTIPALQGQTAGAAHNALAALGLVPVEGSATQKSTDIVSSTSPSAGSKVSPGTNVTIIAAPAPAGSSGGGSSSSGGGGGGGNITVVPQNFRVSMNGLTATLTWTNPPVPAGQGPVRSVVVAYGQSASSLPYTVSEQAGATSTQVVFNAGPGSQGLTHYFEAWYDPAAPGGPHAGPISAKTT